MSAIDGSVSCIHVSKCPKACCKAVVLSISISLKCQGPYMTAGKMAVMRFKSDDFITRTLKFLCFFLGQVNSHFYEIKNKT